MEHLTGNVSQSVRNDFGPFIEIKGHRIRKEIILHYSPREHKGETGITYLVFITFMHGHPNFQIVCDSMDEARNFCEKLDWEFKKDYK